MDRAPVNWWCWKCSMSNDGDDEYCPKCGKHWKQAIKATPPKTGLPYVWVYWSLFLMGACVWLSWLGE